MLLITRSVWRLRRNQYFQYSGSTERRSKDTNIYSSVVQQLEKDGERILRIAQRRAEERINLLKKACKANVIADDVASARNLKELEPIHDAWNEWVRTKQLLQETTPLLNDPDPSMRSLAVAEYDNLISTLSRHLTTVFPDLLVPKSTTAHLSAIIELKSGVGGSEASLFLSDLLRMYLRLANSAKWTSHIISSNSVDGGGVKDTIVEIRGAGSYDALRWESGVHRVQRVPTTETSGRVHTSTVAVVVLPLSDAESPAGDDDELFSLNEVKIEVMRSRGAGGQHVNKTESAVRLTHQPTGITVSMQDERSQHQNKRRAFQILRARLMDIKLTREMMERRTVRRNLVKTADRSEKIRTYNYAQDRVTDHRIRLSQMNLMSVMEGDGLWDIIEALRRNHYEAVMEDLLE